MKERGNLRDISIDNRIILKVILDKMGVRLGTVFAWLDIEANDWLLLAPQLTLNFGSLKVSNFCTNATRRRIVYSASYLAIIINIIDLK
jgi:hypothetical protein